MLTIHWIIAWLAASCILMLGFVLGAIMRGGGRDGPFDQPDASESQADELATEDYIDLSKVPRQFNYVAVQPTGSVFVFGSEPAMSHNQDWWYNRDEGLLAEYLDDSRLIDNKPDWRESLRRRPR